MKFNGVDFNEEVTLSQSMEDFANSDSNAHLWPELSATSRVQQLETVYKALQKYADAVEMPKKYAEVNVEYPATFEIGEVRETEKLSDAEFDNITNIELASPEVLNENPSLEDE